MGVATQVLPAQHPLQLIAVQTQVPPLHASPWPHAAPEPQPQVPSARQTFDAPLTQLAHAPPLRPQLPVLGTGTQVLPMQQPVGHDVESHTQPAGRHRWPCWHAAPPLH